MKIGDKEEMKQFLYKLMEYRIIYWLMPKYTKFIYCFNIMLNNKSGCLHLGNGYWLNFKTMTIEGENTPYDSWNDCYVAFKNGKYFSGTDESGNFTHTKNEEEAARFHCFPDAMRLFEQGYAIIKITT